MLPNLREGIVFRFYSRFTAFRTVFIACYCDLLWLEWSIYAKGGTGYQMQAVTHQTYRFSYAPYTPEYLVLGGARVRRDFGAVSKLGQGCINYHTVGRRTIPVLRISDGSRDFRAPRSLPSVWEYWTVRQSCAISGRSHRLLSFFVLNSTRCRNSEFAVTCQL